MYKRIIRPILRVMVVVFVLFNVIIIFHAYKFTHFGTEEKKIGKQKQFTTADKIKTILFGVESTRPGDPVIPSQPYDTVYVQKQC